MTVRETLEDEAARWWNAARPLTHTTRASEKGAAVQGDVLAAVEAVLDGPADTYLTHTKIGYFQGDRIRAVLDDRGAAELARIKAEAWDQGYRTAQHDAQPQHFGDEPRFPTENPHR